MPPLVALTSVHGAFPAHVLAARLTSEGIDVELRGAVGGAYGLTMGDMARVDLFVPEDQMEDAQLVLLASEIDAAMDLRDRSPDRGRCDDGDDGDDARRTSWVWIAALVLIVVAVAAPVLRLLAS